ncbi:hypothetical protein LTR85_011774 [Meristemomyces frigidus]|nr:hypothetical protein LTR85_011774 [Meristemomyces frigidus]
MAQYIDPQTLRWNMGSTSRILAVLGTAATLALCVFLPAAIALVRIEAALLPPSERTIVAFDRSVIIAGLSEQSSVYATYLAPLTRAMRSIDCRAMRSVLKQYVWWGGALLLASGVHVS